MERRGDDFRQTVRLNRQGWQTANGTMATGGAAVIEGEALSAEETAECEAFIVPLDPVYDFVVVVGAAESGKSEVGRQLAALRNRMAVETSDLLRERLARIEGSWQTPATAELIQAKLEMYREFKRQHRPMLRELGEQLTMANPGVLVEQAIERGGKIIVGIRRWREIDGGIMPLRISQRVCFIEVRRPGQAEIKDSFELGDISQKLPCFTIINDGSLEELREKVSALRIEIR